MVKKELKIHALVSPTETVVVSAYDKNGKADACTLAFYMVSSHVPPCVTIAINATLKRKTLKNILAQGAFVLSFPSVSQVKEADYLGVESGYNTDKLKNIGFTTSQGSTVFAPVINELKLSLECKVVHQVTVGSHVQITGEVKNIVADESILNENDKVVLEKLQPLIYDEEQFRYLSIGGKVSDAFKPGAAMKKNFMTAQKYKIGSMELDGKIIMPPIATYRCDDNGYVTDEICKYYGERAGNPNISLIITEHNFITKQGIAKQKQMSIADDGCIPGLKKLVDAIHENGAKAVSQLNHAGTAAVSEVSGMETVAPSAVILPTNPPMGGDVLPHELAKEEIAVIVDEFAAAASRAKAAGYDGVEIHSAHGYLLNQFYSPLTNKRNDEYGGSIENRVRIHYEVIRAVRQAVGTEYPVFIRFGASDYMEGGSTLEDAIQAAKIFEAAGVDLIDVSGGMCRYIREGHQEPGYFQDAGKAIKEVVSIPVNLTGGVKTMNDANELLNKGVCDFVGVGRELFKDAAWETEI